MTLPPVDPDWWRTLFDEVYLKTDARTVQDDVLTRREVDGLIQTLVLRPREIILDLCGGHGRHALELARRGFHHVLVVDFAHPLLRHGQAQAHREGLPVTFVRADARAVPLAPGCCDVVALLANSFGYGATRQDDLKILQEACRLLKENGRLFLEVADADFVRHHLPPQSWHEAGDLVVCRRRWVTAQSLVCRELVISRERGMVRDCTYRVRLYDPETLRTCLGAAGFSQIWFAPQTDPGVPLRECGSLSRRLQVVAWK